MHVSEARRTILRVAPAMLVSAAVAVLSVSAVPSAAATAASRPAARTAPMDLYRGQQWTLNALHITRAWKYSRGNGVTIAVLDTGVDGHQPDLSGHVIDGPDFTGHARKPGNRYWGRHGTEMASLIAGHGHGRGDAAGVMGVAPDAKILSIRVTWELGDPIRTEHAQVDHARDAVANGIRYAADHGAQVISMSLGGGNLFYNGNAAEKAAIHYALGKGAVLIASAGNDGNGPNRRNYPAAYPGVIAVGAVDRGFKAAKFTNRHPYISVAAPGVEIVSADTTGHGYILGTGTSSSAAFVAGISALARARYPRLTPPEIKQALEESATHRPPDGRNTEIGTGVADAYGTLRTAARIDTAEHGGAIDKPQSTARPSSSSAKHEPNLLLIAVLGGGGTLLVLSLILGWRQRRRHPGAADDDDKELQEFPALPVGGARASSRTDPPPDNRRSADTHSPRRLSSAGTSSGRSPWERRPPDALGGDVPERDPGSLDAPPSPTGLWDQRQRPTSPRDVWEPPQEPPPPEPVSDDSRTGSPRSGSILNRSLPEPPGWDEPEAPPSSSGRPGSSSEPSSPEPDAHDLPFSGGQEPDPLTDDQIDSSVDVGTPLADESWDSIRRGFDRLKNAQNWESLANGDLHDADELPAQDAFDETASLPIIKPDADEGDRN